MRIKLHRGVAAWTLIEMMFGVAVFAIAGGAMGTAYLFSLRSFQSLSNYSVLSEQNREAIDRITRELRQANSIQSFDNYLSRKLVFFDGNNKQITYTFNRYTQQLTRTSNGVSSVLLDDCSLINFNLGTRVVGSNYNYSATTDADEAKIVDLTWRTSRSLPGGPSSSENIQTAKIVIRKQAITQ